MAAIDFETCLAIPENDEFFMIRNCFLKIVDADYVEASALRILETMTNVRIAQMREQEDGSRKRRRGSELDFWLTVYYSRMVRRSLGLYGKSSFQHAMTRLEQRRFVHSRFVVLGEDGELLASYEAEVSEDGTISYPGMEKDKREKVKQYLLDREAVGRALRKLRPQPPVPPRPLPDADEEQEEDQEEETDETQTPDGEDQFGPSSAATDGDVRGGNLQPAAGTVTDTPPLNHTPLVKSTGGDKGAIQCPVDVAGEAGESTKGSGESSRGAATTNRGTHESTKGSGESSRGAATFTSNIKGFITDENPDRTDAYADTDSVPDGGTVFGSITFDEALVRRLAAEALLPLPTKVRATQRKDNERRWQEAAERIARASYFALIGGGRNAAESLRDILHYVTDADSPSWWVREFARHPRNTVRLWHIADNLHTIMQDLARHPEWQPPTRTQSLAHIPMTPPDAIPVEEDSEPGMAEQEALLVCEALAHVPYRIGVTWRYSSKGGVVVEVWWRYISVLYTPDQIEQVLSELEQEAAA